MTRANKKVWGEFFRLAAFLSLFWLCSCATEKPDRQLLPHDVRLNENAGRGDFITVTLDLGNGKKLPFIVDTGSPWTMFEKGEAAKLGAPLSTNVFWNFGVKQDSLAYRAPPLFLGGAPLVMTGTEVSTLDFKQLAFKFDRPGAGILGMDIMEHYCIQFDFTARKMRFLDSEHADKSKWGEPFALTNIGDGCCIIGENLAGVKNASSIIDCGCDSDGWLTPAVFQQWTNQIQSVTNGMVHRPLGLLGKETYSDMELEEVKPPSPASEDTHIIYNGIGLHFLSRHLVTFDFPNHVMYLKRTSEHPLYVRDEEATAHKMAKSSMKFLYGMLKNGKLPGWSKSDKPASDTLNFHVHFPGESEIEVIKKGEISVYHYRCVRANQGSPWKLQKAWRTDAAGRIVEELKVP